MIEGSFQRFWEDLIGRWDGPMAFRILLQPTMAIFFAIRDGWKDAKAGRPPYFWDIFFGERNAWALLIEGWKSVARVFFLAIAMDIIYQYLVFRWFYPVETLLVATILALLPYLMLRGPANRLLRRWIHGGKKA